MSQGIVTASGILLEGATWALIFVIFFENGICRLVERSLRRAGFYEKLHKEKGMICNSMAEEVITMSGTGAQHVFAGTLILVGTLTGSLRLVRAGLLCEWGWEAKDLLNLVTGTGLYRGSDVPENIKASMRFHHLPGILSAPPLLLYGIHGNVHVQRIGLMMIYGGGIGVLANDVRLVVKYCMESKRKLVWGVGCVEVFFCFGFLRFVVFPIEVAGLLADLYSVGLIPVAIVVALAFAMMSKFNIVIFRLKYNKLMAPDVVVKVEPVVRESPPLSRSTSADAATETKKVVQESIKHLGLLQRQSSSVRIASGRRL